ncbi:MAG TPA: response regulator [Stellaceae bacterium]|nr:response regulator [Stellaceae bacterium]
MTVAMLQGKPAPRILLVEDDQVFLHTLEMVLRDAGFEVVAVADYAPALGHLDGEQRIDVLLTDIVMPDRVNGLALARMARLRRPELKFVYFTAYDIPSAENEAMGIVLQKPFDNEQLVAAIHNALAKAAEDFPE